MNVSRAVTCRRSSGGRIFRIALPSLAAWVVAMGSLLWPRVAHGGGGPENVLLVVNANSQASKTIANHWIRYRAIPPIRRAAISKPPRMA